MVEVGGDGLRATLVRIRFKTGREFEAVTSFEDLSIL